MIGSAVFAARLLHPKRGVLSNFIVANPESWTNRLYPLWYPIVVSIPLALAVLALLEILLLQRISITSQLVRDDGLRPAVKGKQRGSGVDWVRATSFSVFRMDIDTSA